MKQVEKNEVDLLLRALAKRHGRAAGDPEGQLQGEHLDADELNSYAEDALPTAARARYTAHLADCSRCRQLVSQLAVVAGPRARTDVVAGPAGSSFWRRFGSFFSPSFLKYALPALVLISAVGIGVIVFKQQPSNDFVAQKSDAPAAQPATVRDDTTTEESATKNEIEGFHSREATKSSPSPVATVRTEEEDKLAKQNRAETEKNASTRNEATDKVTPTEEQRTYSPEPTAPARPQPKTDEDVTVTTDAPAKEKADAAKAQDQERKDLASADARKRESERGRGSAAAQTAGAAAPPSPRVSGLRRAEQADQNQAAEAGAKEKKSGETRSVAGRQFRREANGWIDTAYNSSRSAVNIRRGSEQYRALIADEPGLMTIAEALSGPVTVVWKGRAYRIQ
ncbi:MAG TPA: hypothetical protein VIB00_10000 [Pyrinomonadaceae bacterium]